MECLRPHVWLNDHFPARLTSQQISFHDHFRSFLFLAWLGLFKRRRGTEREREPAENFSPSLKGFVWGRLSERPLPKKKKGPDHHWMTLRGATKPNWSRPPAANGPERNSPGWVMTVFSAFLFTPFWCPRTPHLTPAATTPPPPPLRSPLPPPFSQPWVALSSRVIHTNPSVRTMVLVTVSVCEELLATNAADRSGRENHMFGWDMVPQPGGGACLAEKPGPSVHKVCLPNWRYSCVQRKVVLERQLAYFIFVYSFHYFYSRLKSNTMTLDKGIRPPGNLGQQYSNFYFTLP